MSTIPVPPPLWVRYDPRTPMLASATVGRLTELVHRRLTDTVWGTGLWPLTNSPATLTLARVTRREWVPILRELRVLGWHPHGPRLVHHGVQAVMQAAISAQNEATERGKQAAKARWNGSTAGTGFTAPAPHAGVFPTLDACALHPQSSGNASKVNDKQNEDITSAVTPDERLSHSASPRKQLRSKEKAFLKDVSETIALFGPRAETSEMANWGGWWRNRFRENPSKAEHVLADIRSMIREHRVLTTPGAAASDLWKRLP